MGSQGRSCLTLKLGSRLPREPLSTKAPPLTVKPRSRTLTCAAQAGYSECGIRKEGTTHSRRLDYESPQFKSEKGASFLWGFRGRAQNLGAGKSLPCHVQSVAPAPPSHSTKGTLDPHLPPKTTLSVDVGSSTPVTLESTHAPPDTASTLLT